MTMKTAFGLFDAVIFDLFGTLVENSTSAAMQDSFDQMAHALGAEHEPFQAAFVAAWQERASGDLGDVEGSLRAVCARLGHVPPQSGIALAATIRRAAAKTWLRPRKDALKVLHLLRQRGGSLGLISDCGPEVPDVWPGSTLCPALDHVSFSCVERVRKPDARIYQRTARALGVDASHCLYVGDDSSNELAGAKAVGMQAVLIDARSESGEQLMPTVRLAPWQGPRITLLSELLG